MTRTPTLVLASLGMAAAPVAAQSGINLVGGLVSAKFSQEIDGASNDDHIANRSGFALGVSLDHGLNSRLSFAPELLYTIKGGKDPTSNANLKFSYIELPLLFRFKFLTGGPVRPFITAGLAVSFLKSCAFIDDRGDSQHCSDYYGKHDSYGRTDLGALAGAGVTVRRIGISLRFEQGLMDISTAKEFISKNRTLVVLGSFAF